MWLHNRTLYILANPRSSFLGKGRMHPYVKTILFQTIQLSISTQFSPNWPKDRTLSGATTCTRTMAIKVYSTFPQSSSITGALPSNCLVPYPGHSLGESYPSTEMQWMYSTALADCAVYKSRSTPTHPGSQLFKRKVHFQTAKWGFIHCSIYNIFSNILYNPLGYAWLWIGDRGNTVQQGAISALSREEIVIKCFVSKEINLPQSFSSLISKQS